jgi:hypothetical protein
MFVGRPGGHINHHMTNVNREDQGGGGLMMILNVTR